MKKKNSEKLENRYGQLPEPTESPELIESKLKELDDELGRMDDSDKQGWLQALERCPELVQDDHKLMFLRCEVFSVDLAAKRLAMYWNKRIDLFGPERAFSPLTIDGALPDDETALSVGYLRVVPAKDPDGRGIAFADPGRLDSSLYSVESMTRVYWYCAHAILEDESSQIKGIVFISYPRNFRMSQLSGGLMQSLSSSSKGCLPVRVSVVHVVHPPALFSAIYPIVKVFLAERVKQRMKIHSGSTKRVLEKLAKYGLTQDQLPTDIGGNITLDHDTWVADRKARGL